MGTLAIVLYSPSKKLDINEVKTFILEYFEGKEYRVWAKYDRNEIVNIGSHVSEPVFQKFLTAFEKEFQVARTGYDYWYGKNMPEKFDEPEAEWGLPF